MSAFYGMIQGNRGEATRGGSKNSGFHASCQSYDGSVCTFMDYDSNNQLIVQIQIADGSACYGKTYFRGTLEELKKKLEN